MGMRKPVSPAGAGPAPRVTFEGLEVSQAVQDPANSVTLIAGKTTIARLYLGTPDSARVRVRGTLTVKNGAQTAVSVSSINELVVDPALNGAADRKRHDVSLSLNFLLPPTATAAAATTLQIASVVVPSTGQAATVGGATTVTITFVDGAPLRLRLIGIRYQDANGSQTATPTQRDADMIFSWLRRAYPIARLDATFAVVNANRRWPFASTDINAQLAAIRRQDVASGTDRRTHYYGVVPDTIDFMRGSASALPTTAPDPSVVASGPTGSSDFGWDTDGVYGDWYAGHELAHTFGRLHPGHCNGNSRDDLAFPYANGQLADGSSARFVGLDTGDSAMMLPLAALPGQNWHDVMTYCERQWTSAYTYDAIRLRLLAEEAMGAGAQAGAGLGMAMTDSDQRLVNVVATLDLIAGTGEIQYVQPIAAPAADDYEKSSDGSAQLRIHDRNFNVIDEVTVPYRLESDPEDGRQTAIVDAVIRVPEDAANLTLLHEGRELHTFSRAARLSNVSGVRGVADAGPAPNAIAWDSPEAGDPAVTYLVQVSRDGGLAWETVAVGVPDPIVALDPADYPDASELQVRVRATDGFMVTNVSESTVRLR